MSIRDAAARVALIAAFVGGIGYMATWSLNLSDAAHTVWKGSGVGLLAAYCALRAREPDGWLIATVMALGALGDVLLEVIGLTRGAVAFLAGHLAAVVLYLRNRRTALAAKDWIVAAAIVPATVVIAYLLPADRAGAPGVAIYALGLSLMAASAWLSRFPRGWVALGAIMFLVSDLLIFARSGPLAGQAWVGFGVWILYFFGQAAIALGVTRVLARPERARSPALA